MKKEIKKSTFASLSRPLFSSSTSLPSGFRFPNPPTPQKKRPGPSRRVMADVELQRRLRPLRRSPPAAADPEADPKKEVLRSSSSSSSSFGPRLLLGPRPSRARVPPRGAGPQEGGGRAAGGAGSAGVGEVGDPAPGAEAGVLSFLLLGLGGLGLGGEAALFVLLGAARGTKGSASRYSSSSVNSGSEGAAAASTGRGPPRREGPRREARRRRRPGRRRRRREGTSVITVSPSFSFRLKFKQCHTHSYILCNFENEESQRDKARGGGKQGG